MGQSVELPYAWPDSERLIRILPASSYVEDQSASPSDIIQVPEGWRMIATMNVFDKSLLFEMAFALMRRFAFIEVAAPQNSTFESLIRREALIADGDPEIVFGIIASLLKLRSVKELGPALFMDMARSQLRGSTLAKSTTALWRFSCFTVICFLS